MLKGENMISLSEVFAIVSYIITAIKVFLFETDIPEVEKKESDYDLMVYNPINGNYSIQK